MVLFIFTVSCSSIFEGENDFSHEKKDSSFSSATNVESNLLRSSAESNLDAAIPVAIGIEFPKLPSELEEYESDNLSDFEKNFFRWTERLKNASGAIVVAYIEDQVGNGLNWSSQIVVTNIIRNSMSLDVPDNIQIRYPAHAHSLDVDVGKKYIIEIKRDGSEMWYGVPYDELSSVLVRSSQVPLFGKPLQEILTKINEKE